MAVVYEAMLTIATTKPYFDENSYIYIPPFTAKVTPFM
jgi:hypothetical protein